MKGLSKVLIVSISLVLSQFSFANGNYQQRFWVKNLGQDGMNVSIASYKLLQGGLSNQGQGSEVIRPRQRKMINALQLMSMPTQDFTIRYDVAVYDRQGNKGKSCQFDMTYFLEPDHSVDHKSLLAEPINRGLDCNLVRAGGADDIYLNVSPR